MGFTLRWWFFHPYSDWNVKRAAKKDALEGIPAVSGSLHPPFIRQIKQVADANIRSLGEEWRKKEAPLKAKWLELRKEISYLNQLNKEEKGEYQDACVRLKQKYGLDPEHLKSGRLIKYFFLVIPILLVEVAINLFAFRAAHEGEVTTIIFALAVGLVLAIIGHFMGTQAKDRQAQGKGLFHWSLFGFVVLALMIISGLVWIRLLWLEHRAGGEGNASFSLAYLLLFLGLNLGLLVITSILAYNSHVEGEHSTLKARKSMARRSQRIEKLEEMANRLKTSGEYLRDRYFRRAARVKDIAQRLFYLYFEYNLRGRNENGYPECYQKKIDLDSTIEKSFPAMEWEKDEEQSSSLGGGTSEDAQGAPEGDGGLAQPEQKPSPGSDSNKGI